MRWLTRWFWCLRIRAVFAGKVKTSTRLSISLGRRSRMGLPADGNDQIDDEPGLSILSPEHAVFIAIFARNPKKSRWGQGTQRYYK